MTSVYLILAHRNFQQLRRLITRLLASDAGVIVHVDSGAQVPADFFSEFAGKALVTDHRFSTVWGSFELVEATLALLEKGLRSFPDTKYFSLLSGQDYPIKSASYLDNFFQQSDSDFIRYAPLLEEQWKYGGKKRVNKFYWARNRKSLAGFLFRTVALPPRLFPIPIERVFAGSQWWSLRRATVQQLLHFTDSNPELLRAFRRTYIPDEMFFQTILAGFLNEQNLVNDNLRFIEHFSLPRDYLRLKILNRNGIKDLGVADFEKLKSSPALFARKFDASKDSQIFDLLDTLTEADQGTPVRLDGR